MQQTLGPEQIPDKHLAKWFHIVELKIWIDFAKYVLALGTIAGLTIYVGNTFPEALKFLPPVVAGICSLAGIAIGIDRYRNRSKHHNN